MTHRGAHRPDCYPQVAKQPLCILVPALVLALAFVRCVVIAPIDLLEQNARVEQSVVRMETIDLRNAVASLVFIE